MAAAAYISKVEKLELPELLMEAEEVLDAANTAGWQIVQASIDAHRDRLTRRLVQQNTKAEDAIYLRGQIEALGAMREAADAIQALAKDREAKATKSARAQEIHV